MKTFWMVSWAGLVLGVVAVVGACGPAATPQAPVASSSEPLPAVSLQQDAPALEEPTQCALPAWTETLEGGLSRDLGRSFLKSISPDTYELETVDVFVRKYDRARGALLSAFQTQADRIVDRDGFRSYELSSVCQEKQASSEEQMQIRVTFPLATALHTPSGRITAFDEKDGEYAEQLDLDFPLLSDFSVSLEENRYIPISARVSAPPYVKFRKISEVLDLYRQVRVLKTPSGLEMRLGVDEPRQHTRVIVQIRAIYSSSKSR